LATKEGWCPDGERDKFAAYHAETTATPARWSWLWRSWISKCNQFGGIKYAPPTITPGMTADEIKREQFWAEMRKYGVT
jgi:hypothetical protein